MSYNNPDDLKAKFKSVGEQYTDNDLQNELDAAHRKLDSKVGSRFVERDRAETDDQEKFVLSFSEVNEFKKIRDPADSSDVDDSKYTVDKSKGFITFTTSYAEDNIFVGKEFIFYYIPSIFKDLERWLAIKSIVMTTSLQNRNSESQINTEDVQNTIDSLVDEINRKAGNAHVLDHRPRFMTHVR